MSIATRQENESLAEARHLHRPAMSPGEAITWIFGWSLGLGTLWYFALGFVVGVRGGFARFTPTVVAVVTVAHLLLPGIGVWRPGGARAPVILRAALPAAVLWLAASYGLWRLTLPGGGPLPLLALLAVFGAPLLGVPLSYGALVGRSPARGALLAGGAIVTALFSLLAPALAAIVARAELSWGFQVGLALALAAAVTLARGATRLGAMNTSRWRDGRAEANALRLGDDLYAKPDALKGYVGPVCVFAPRVGASAPGRGGRPIDPQAVLPCAMEQLPMLLTDAHDASSALALMLGAAGALSTASALSIVV